MQKEHLDIYKILAEVYDVKNACDRIQESDDPSDEDYDIVRTYLKKQLQKNEWIDLDWDEEMAQLPLRVLYMQSPDDPWLKSN